MGIESGPGAALEIEPSPRGELYDDPTVPTENSEAEIEPKVLTAMITPFNERGRFNPDGAQAIADYLINHGSDGLVLAGTTGESPVLTPKEQLNLFKAVRQAVGDKVLLIGGTGSNNTDEAVELTGQTERQGAVNGVLVVSPYYNRPSQYGIVDYFNQVKRAAKDLPVILYNIPVRTGRPVETEAISWLHERGMIQGIKDATGTTEMAEELARRHGPELEIYSGDDALNLEFLRKAGAVGAISVASHWAGREISQMFDAYSAGNMTLADLIQIALVPSFNFESTHIDSSGKHHDTPNPIPTKVMMTHVLGSEIVGGFRSPMIPAPQEQTYLLFEAPRILADLGRSMVKLGLQ